MPQGLRLHPTKVVHTISEFIRLNKLRVETPGRIHNGKLTHLVNGEWIDSDTFNELFPIVEYRPLNWKSEDIGKYANLQ